MKIPSFIPIILVAGVPFITHAGTYTWNGTSGAAWSSTANWLSTSGTYPATGDTAILGNVTTGTNIAIYDATANGTLGTLSLVQTSAGATNELKVQRNLTLTSDLTVAATSGTAFLYLAASATNSTVVLQMGSGSNGNLTIGSGGRVMLGSYGTSKISGNVTISGGVLQMERGFSGSKSDIITGSVTMSSGTITVGVTALTGTTNTSTDNRFQVNGNFIATGGAITNANGGGLFLNGASIDLSGLTSYATNLGLNLRGNTASGNGSYNQSLNLGNTTIGALLFTDDTGGSFATKTISSTGGKVGAITFYSVSGASITMALGSDLTLSSGAAMPTMNTTTSGTLAPIYFDTAGHTLDLSQGSGAFKTVNQGATSVSWNFQGDGTIKARSFVFSTGTNITNVLGNTVLQVTGASTSATGTLIDLGTGAGSGTISASSTLLYSGTDSAAAPATLISNRAIGKLTVQSGYLKIGQAALNTGGEVAVTSGTLDLNGINAAGLVTLAADKDFTMTGGSLVLDLGTTQDEIFGSGSGKFKLTDATLVLILGTGFDYSDQYTLFSGFTGGNTSNLTITGYNSVDYTAVLSDSGVLTFTPTAVPEPSSVAFAVMGSLGLFATARRWKKRC